jgi:DNA repair exonuclease SbcCD ATPase subunit
MFIKSVKLSNFCQHTDKTITFEKGLNAIVGPNGSGKSNILTAIYGGITGNFSRNAGVLSDNVSINRIAGKECSVELQLSHGSEDIKIVRWIDPSKRELTLAGNTYTSEAEFKKKLLEVLDVDEVILDQYCFVEQWDHFGPFNLTPAKRISAFQKLFRIDQLNNVCEQIGKSDYKAAILNFSYNKTDLEKELADKQASLETLKKVVEDYPTIESLDDKIISIVNDVNACKEKIRLAASISSRLSYIDNYTTQMSGHEKRLNHKKEELAAKMTSYSEGSALRVQAEQAELLWNKYSNYVGSKNRISTAIANLEKEKALNPTPQKPENYIEDENEANTKLDSFKYYLAFYKNMVKSIDVNDKKSRCPVCATPAENLASNLKEAEEQIKQISPQVDALTDALRVTMSFDKSMNSYLVWKKTYDDRLNQLNFEKSKLIEVSIPSISMEDSKKIISEAQVLNKEIEAINKAINETNLTIKGLLSGIEQQSAEIEKDLELQKNYERVDENKLADLETELEFFKAEKLKVGDARLEHATMAAEVKSIKEKISNANLERQMAERQVSWNSRLDRLKKVFKHDALPMAISRKHMERVVIELNNTLSYIGLPFTIELDANLGFEAKFRDFKISASRLSGGQKIILTIAFRLAVNATFASNLGLLCLDEPTVGLDEINLHAMEMAFERLKEFSAANDIQIIVVSHEKGISHLFNNTIDLG